jgi:hypothetical protein
MAPEETKFEAALVLLLFNRCFNSVDGSDTSLDLMYLRRDRLLLLVLLVIMTTSLVGLSSCSWSVVVHSCCSGVLNGVALMILFLFLCRDRLLLMLLLMTASLVGLSSSCNDFLTCQYAILTNG